MELGEDLEGRSMQRISRRVGRNDDDASHDGGIDDDDAGDCNDPNRRTTKKTFQQSMIH